MSQGFFAPVRCCLHMLISKSSRTKHGETIIPTRRRASYPDCRIFRDNALSSSGLSRCWATENLRTCDSSQDSGQDGTLGVSGGTPIQCYLPAIVLVASGQRGPGDTSGLQTTGKLVRVSVRRFFGPLHPICWTRFGRSSTMTSLSVEVLCISFAKTTLPVDRSRHCCVRGVRALMWQIVGRSSGEQGDRR